LPIEIFWFLKGAVLKITRRNIDTGKVKLEDQKVPNRRENHPNSTASVFEW
jgi:hypothetical protein